MPSNFRVSSDIDTFLRKATKEEAAAFLVGATYAPINNPTFTGTVGLAAADFNVGNAGGEVSWNNQERTLDLVTGSDNVTIQVGQEVLLYARNNSGSAMSDGQVVIISGSQGNRPTISLAQANTVESARKTIGVVTQSIPNNSNGFVTLIGKVRDLVLDSGTFTEGEVVYLSDTVAGGITNVKPDIVVELGHILATSTGGNTNGVLEVQINNESSVYDLEQKLTRDLNVKDSITITADKTPDDNAKLLMIDKSTGATRQGALEKVDGRLLIGPDETQQWEFKIEGSTPVFQFPANAGLRFNAGKELKEYDYGTFTPIFALNGTTQQSTYAVQQGYYVKIGRAVTVNIFIKITDFDAAFKTASASSEIGIIGLPHSAKIEGADGPDTMIVSVHPKRGWIQLGDRSYNGAVGSSPDGVIYFDKNVGQGSSAAGVGWNYARIKVGDFNTHPFNFTADGVKAFTFQISGTYITDDDV
jgi:hypothetical protein